MQVIGFFGFIRRLMKEISEDDVSGAAAELSYRFFLAVFPFAIFLAALGGFIASSIGVDNPTEEIMDAVGDQLPADSASLLRRQIDDVVTSKSAGLLTIGIAGTIWAASSAVGTIMKATNKAYGVKETRKLWTRYGIALGLTALGGVALIGAFVLSFAGQIYGMEIADALGFGGAAGWVIPLLRIPLAMVFIMSALSFLYWLAPNAQLPFKFITPGALLFTITWLIVSYLFGLYVANFGSYNATYGTLGAVVVALIWFYITAFILLVGAELNAVLAKEVAPGEMTKATEPAARTKNTETKGIKAPRRKHRLAAVLPMIVGAAAGLVSLVLRRGGRHKPAVTS